MSAEKDITTVRAPATDDCVAYVSWIEDSWQRGDPMGETMFDVNDVRRQFLTDRDRQTRAIKPDNKRRDRARKSQD